mmetsp:Transcript_38853/g.93652  ORF Transcript_38853/g.93652 Transcript_38853/m.93652 type:complete len:251 (+) Transcript_38853:176-928(+)
MATRARSPSSSSLSSSPLQVGRAPCPPAHPSAPKSALRARGATASRAVRVGGGGRAMLSTRRSGTAGATQHPEAPGSRRLRPGGQRQRPRIRPRPPRHDRLWLFCAHHSRLVHGKPAAILDGQCGAGVLAETQINEMHIGTYAQQDCGELSEDKQWKAQHCRKDGDSVRADRDCYLARVGDLIMNVPLSLPVRNDLVQSLGWSVRTALQEGTFNEKRAEFKQKLIAEKPLQCGEDGSLIEASQDPLESLR